MAATLYDRLFSVAAASTSSGSTRPHIAACQAGHVKAEPQPRQKTSASIRPCGTWPPVTPTTPAIVQAQAAMKALQKNRNLGRCTPSAITPANRANRKTGT
jgi:hypothetical protein